MEKTLQEVDMQYTFGWGEPELVKAVYRYPITDDEVDALLEIIEYEADEWLDISQSDLPEKFLALMTAVPPEDREDEMKALLQKHEEYLEGLTTELNGEAEWMEEYYTSSEWWDELLYTQSESNYDSATIPEDIMELAKEVIGARDASEVAEFAVDYCVIDGAWTGGYGYHDSYDNEDFVHIGSFPQEEVEIQLPDELGSKLEDLSEKEFQFVARSADIYVSESSRGWGYLSVQGNWAWFCTAKDVREELEDRRED